MQSLWMIIASLCFACMGVCVKLSAQYFSATEVVFYRCAVSLVFVLALVRWRRLSLRTAHWRFQLTRSLCGFTSLVCLFYAITLLPLATAVTLNYTSPLFLALFLGGFGKISLRLSSMSALALGFLGVVLLLQPTFRADQLMGGVLGLASGVISGMSYYNIRELGELGETEERTVFYFTFFSTIGSGLWMFLDTIHPLTMAGVPLLLGVGGFATAGQLAMTRAYKRGNTLVSASLAYSTVIFSCLFGVLFWNETLSPLAWGAILLIVASGVSSSWFSRPPAD